MYNFTDFGATIKQIFVPIPVLPKKKGGSIPVPKEEILTGIRCHKAR